MVTFKQDTINLIKSICKSRKRLITQNKSSINKAWAFKKIEEIDTYLTNYNLTRKGIAKYLIKHFDDIKHLSSSWEQKNKLNQLLQKAESYKYL
jgi:hypothetical protein